MRWRSEIRRSGGGLGVIGVFFFWEYSTILYRRVRVHCAVHSGIRNPSRLQSQVPDTRLTPFVAVDGGVPATSSQTADVRVCSCTSAHDRRW